MRSDERRDYGRNEGNFQRGPYNNGGNQYSNQNARQQNENGHRFDNRENSNGRTYSQVASGGQGLNAQFAGNRNNPAGTSAPMNRDQQNPRACFSCGREGHIAAYCENNRNHQSGPRVNLVGAQNGNNQVHPNVNAPPRQ